ncbi:MAG: hypothetical protein J5964_06265 [Eubacterium sp.]|nr:hypothetical protein [Eubacterium sp.]
MGDTKVLNRNGREYVLIEATEDGYIEIANGNYEKVRAINEQAYRDAAISSRVLTERIRIESGRDRWSAFDDDEREYGARNRGQARRAGLQDDTAGDAEHLRSGHQETSDDVNYSRSEHFATREEYLSLANRYWAIEDTNAEYR